MTPQPAKPQSARPQAASLPPASARHYLVLCGLCLGIIFLVHLQQGLFLGNLLAVMIGALGLASKLRIGPMLLVVSVALVQMYYQGQVNRVFGPRRSVEFTLQVHELILCAAVLGYVAGQYRLQSIWLNLWPEDPRQRAGPLRRPFPWFWQRQAILQEKRPAQKIAPLELVWFVLSLPAWALVGIVAWGFLSQRWNLVGLPPVLVRIMFVVFFLAIASLVARMALGYWRQRRRNEKAARMFLQETLWQETRGEQRRINRWMAWWKLDT